MARACTALQISSNFSVAVVRFQFFAHELQLKSTKDLNSHSDYTHHALRTNITLECMGTTACTPDERAVCFDLSRGTSRTPKIPLVKMLTLIFFVVFTENIKS